MSKHWLPAQKIQDRYGDRVDFEEPPSVDSDSLEEKKADKLVDRNRRYIIVPAQSDTVDLTDDRSILSAVQRAHTRTFLTRIQDVYFRDPDAAIPEFEIPCNEQTFRIEMRDVSGTLAACEDALRPAEPGREQLLKFGYNIGGGSHHTCPGHGAGYCVLNDIAISLIELKFVRKSIDRAIIIDLDVHQGDGNSFFFPPYYRLKGHEEHLFEWDWSQDTWKKREWYSSRRSNFDRNFSTAPLADSDLPSYDCPILREYQHDWVMTVSLHEENNFPWTKYPSTLDVGLESYMGDGPYMWHVESALTWIDKEERRRVEVNDDDGQSSARQRAGQPAEPGSGEERIVVIYVAGADPFAGDTLGGLNISKEGLRRRDQMVLKWCRDRQLPVAMVLAGGYADVADVADIHFNTFSAAMDM